MGTVLLPSWRLDRTTCWSRPAAALLLILLLLTGWAVRTTGLKHGAPDQVYHPDVSKIAAAASRVYHGEIEELQGPKGDFRFKAYPYGSAVVTGTALRLVDRWTGTTRPVIGADDGASRWYWSHQLRRFAVVLGLLAAAALLILTRPVLSRAGWLLAGLLLMFDPFSVQYSHYGMNDVPMTSFLLFLWVCSAGMGRGGIRGALWSLAGGFCLGLAFGMKYQALIGGLLVVPAWWATLRARSWKTLLVSMGLFAAGCLSAALAVCPLLRNPAVFWDLFVPFMQWQSEIVQRDTAWPVKVGYNLLGTLRAFAGPGYLLLAAAALVGWVRTRRAIPDAPKRWMSGGWLFVLVMIAILVGFRSFPRSNDLLPLVPFLVMPLAFVLSCPTDASGLRRWILPSVSVILVGWFASVSILDSAALARTDTREWARRWCLEHVQTGHKIYRENYTLKLRIEGVNEQMVGLASQGVAKGRILDDNFDMLVLSAQAHERFFDRLSPYYDAKNAAYYRYLYEHYPVLAEFKDRQLFFAQPRILILGPRKEP